MLVCAGLAAGAASAATTTVTVTLSANGPVQPGDSVTLTATVANPASPNGTVTFIVDGSLDASSATTLDPNTLTATYTSSFSAGTHTISAVYRDAAFNTTTAPDIALLVGANPVKSNTTITVTVSPTPVVPDAIEHLTAVVTQTGGTGVPTGMVAFEDNGAALQPGGSQAPLVGGTATIDVGGFGVGPHLITASYSGDPANYASASNSISFSVSGPSPAVQTTTTVTSTPSRITNDLTVVLHAHVVQVGSPTAPPQGSIVTFYDSYNGGGDTLIGQAPLDANNDAQLPKGGWPTGRHVITASYLGVIGAFLTSSGQVTLQVTDPPAGPRPNLIIAAPSSSIAYGDTLPSFTPSYTGFTSGDTAASLSTQPVCATTATSSSPAGTYPITCSGAVDPNYTIVYAAGALTVAKAALTVTAANASITAGQAIPALTATIAGFVNGETLATSGVTGSAACTTTATASSPAGTYPITCTQGTLAAASYRFGTFVAGTLTIASAKPPVVCARPVAHNDDDERHDRGKGSVCEDLLSQPSQGAKPKVKPGQTMSIVYDDETPMATGLLAPTVILGDSQQLPVTVTSRAHGSKRYEALLTFTVPPTLANGTYSIVLTVHDSDGHLDQWIWQIRVGTSSGHDDDRD